MSRQTKEQRRQYMRDRRARQRQAEGLPPAWTWKPWELEALAEAAEAGTLRELAARALLRVEHPPYRLHRPQKRLAPPLTFWRDGGVKGDSWTASAVAASAGGYPAAAP